MLLVLLPALFLASTTSPFIYVIALLLVKVLFTSLCTLSTIISLPQNLLSWFGCIWCSLIDGIVSGFFPLGWEVVDYFKSVFVEYAICLLVVLHEAPFSATCRHSRASDRFSRNPRSARVTLEASKGQMETDEGPVFPNDTVPGVIVDASKILCITGIDDTSALNRTDECTVLILPSSQLGPVTGSPHPAPILSVSQRLRSLIQFNIISNPSSSPGLKRSTTKSRLRSISKNTHRPKRRATGLRNSMSANSLTGSLINNEQSSQGVPAVAAKERVFLPSPLMSSKVNAEVGHPTAAVELQEQRRNESFRNLVVKLKRFQRIIDGAEC